MTSQRGKQTILIKFGHCVENNMENIFLKKSYSNISRPRPYSKK